MSRIDFPAWTSGVNALSVMHPEILHKKRSKKGFTTDAQRFTVSLDDNGNLRKAYFEGSSFFGLGLSVSSEAALTCAIALPGIFCT
ncbi:MAG: hypothetical protein WD317_01445 [Balneolaceae bacterium]